MPNASKINITQATLSDIPVIQDLAHRIWPDNYASILSQGQIAFMMNWMYSTDALTHDMHYAKNYYLIHIDQTPIGFYCIELDHPKKATLYIHKIYILAEYQGKGIGKFALNHIEQWAKDQNQQSIQLNVNRQNKAKEFYQKIGFRILREEDISIGNGYFMNDYVMIKIL